MGVDAFLLPASLLAVLGQRLVRTICPNCKEEVIHPEKVFEELKIDPPAGQPVKLWRGVGCNQCNRSGYKGRIGIYELMTLDERFHDPILRRCGAPEFERLGRERGMKSMFEDGLIKATQGVTTVEELLRVTKLAAK
jgi:type II secretory ATPase GspE/PulE/Tfp pilus assembly ATPase PilB-like protein